MSFLGEFELIARHFSRPTRRALVGPGDDCAVIAPAAGMRLAVSCDMLVEGRHFLSTVDPRRLGHKALAVNLSDLAACGARPLAFTLALALPRPESSWLAALAEGLYALADAHGCELVGGDTTAGPLSLCITVFGEVGDGVAQPGAILRGGARVGDDLWVSHALGGGLGDARLALEVFRGRVALQAAAFERVRLAMECPEPRVALGLALRGVATAAIDVSDGLTGDLAHVLRASQCGARLHADAIPLSADLAAQPLTLQRQCTLTGGDDYELVFTAPAAKRAEVLAAAQSAGVGAACVGVIEAEPGLRIVDAHGRPVQGDWRGFDHFAEGAA